MGNNLFRDMVEAALIDRDIVRLASAEGSEPFQGGAGFKGVEAWLPPGATALPKSLPGGLPDTTILSDTLRTTDVPATIHASVEPWVRATVKPLEEPARAVIDTIAETGMIEQILDGGIVLLSTLGGPWAIGAGALLAGLVGAVRGWRRAKPHVVGLGRAAKRAAANSRDRYRENILGE